jgi:hypothetical protein
MHGQCFEGKLTCIKGYIRDRDTCVRDEKIDSDATALLNKLESLAAIAVGDAICNGRDDSPTEILATPDNSDLASVRLTSNDAPQVYEKLETRLRANSVPCLQYNPKSKSVTSRCPDIPILCQGKLWVLENLYTILGGAIAVFAVIHKAFSLKRNWRIGSESKEVYTAIQ